MQDILSYKGVTDRVTHGWWESFRRRHPEIVLCKGESISHARAECTKVEVLEKYFQELENTLIDNAIIDKPSHIFNMDESGFPLDPKNSFIACGRGQQHASFITSGSKVQITVLACCNAAGYAIPPLIIFDRKILKPELTIGEVPGTMYALSSSGWIDSEIFDLWFQNHFLPYAPASRPLLLILDGHSSHYNPVTIKAAAEEKVLIFCLPPHTTHRTQPFDKGCFGPLKAFWKEECHNYLSANIGKVITRFQFSQIFSKAWMKGMTMKNIVAGFRTTGIYPFNPKALLPQPDIDPQSFSPASLCKRTGLKYIPLYSPVPKFRKGESSSATVTVLSHDELESASLVKSTPHLPNADDVVFDESELSLFQRRFEEGYNLPADKRYDYGYKSIIQGNLNQTVPVQLMKIQLCIYHTYHLCPKY